jgi:hypothetical protein
MSRWTDLDSVNAVSPSRNMKAHRRREVIIRSNLLVRETFLLCCLTVFCTVKACIPFMWSFVDMLAIISSDAIVTQLVQSR